MKILAPRVTLENAKKALAIIACTEIARPPEILEGKVKHVKGFSAGGHEDCVHVAKRTLRGEDPES